MCAVLVICGRVAMMLPTASTLAPSPAPPHPPVAPSPLFGGHGYISEHGMEQIVRDARIAMLYEGTTGIQSLDLLGRKVMGSGGKLLGNFTKLIHKFCKANTENEAMAEFTEPLNALNKQWSEMTAEIGTRAADNAEEIGAASVDYTLFSGYVVLAYLWAKMALISQQRLGEGPGDELDF